MSWQRVRGHDAVVQTFRQALRRGRLAHAYLFTGPPGVGKRLFAVELAKALLCENAAPGTLEACDHCAGCVQVEADTHPDLCRLQCPEGKHEFPIDTMRELVGGRTQDGRVLTGRITLKPVRGRGKVAIIEDADDFNEESANCLLKTLEEPPPGSVLLLIGTRADRQLPTLVSRCQVVRFAPLPDALVDEVLKEQGVADAALRERLVRLGGGSPGQSLELSDPALWEFRRSFLQGLSQPKPDAAALARRWSEFVESAGKDTAAHRRRAAQVVRLLIDFLGGALRTSLGEAAGTGEAAEAEQLRNLANRLGSDRLMELLDRCLEADYQIDRRVQLVLVLEALLDTFAKGT